MTAPLVIYHGACRDGFCAAWCVWSRLGGGDYVPAAYGSLPPDVLGRNVVIVDFSYPRTLLEQMERAADSLIVLDHHKTAEEALRGLDFAHFDMDRSGAGMAWDHFHPGQPRPWIVDYVEDRDLWRHALPDSHIVNAFVSGVAFDFAAWSGAAERRLVDVISLGEAIDGKTRQYVREVAKNARRVMFAGHNVPLVNAPQVDISELLDTLVQGETFAMGWWQRADGTFSYSLRSRGDFDVSALARERGGGGHRNAAGFQAEVMLDFPAARTPDSGTREGPK